MFESPFSHNSARIFRKYPEIEPQEILLDTLARAQETSMLDEKRLEVPLSRNIMRAMFGIFFAVTALFLGKAMLLQVGAHEEMSRAAAQNTLRTEPVFAERGVMYDRFGEQLVFNTSSFDLVCDRRDLPSSQMDKEEMLGLLARLADIDSRDLRRRFDESPRPEVVVQKNMTHEQLLWWETRKSQAEACGIQENIARTYVDGPTFAHVLGYTGNISKEELEQRERYFVGENVGKLGIEKWYQEDLRGRHGKTDIEKDSFGNFIQERGSTNPESGTSLRLWLDADLQRVTENAMRAAFEKIGVQKGAAVALDPRTGGVLALVSMPSFDNNAFSGGMSYEEWELFSQDPARPMFNRAISGKGYPTGSVIKPLVGLAALQEGVIQERTVLDAPLSLCVKNRYTGDDECFADWTYHGSADIKKAIAESVNPFFYKIGGGYEEFRGLGPQRIKEYIERFGWGEKTGIDLPNEGQGVLPELDKDWRLGNTYHFSIGQGPFAVTPLQVAASFAAIGNGGTLLQPQVVRAVGQEEKRPIVLGEDFVNDEYLGIIREGMRRTVTNGTATGFLNRLPVEAAAKTGSAQTGQVIEGQDILHSWIAGFAPYDNPEIALVVIVEDTRTKQPASLEVARDVFQWYFTRTKE